MNEEELKTFEPGCFHKNRKGIYRIDYRIGDRCECTYLNGETFEGSVELLKKIELKVLGYNLPGMADAKAELQTLGIKTDDMEPHEIVFEAGKLRKSSQEKVNSAPMDTCHVMKLKPSYFIVKSVSSWDNKLKSNMKPGLIEGWVTGTNNAGEWYENDRVFVYEGSPSNYIIGLAVIRDPFMGLDSKGKRKYEMKFLTKALPPVITKEYLLDNPATAGASFLKPGNASGVVPLRPAEAKQIYQMVCSVAPIAKKVWPDLVTG